MTSRTKLGLALSLPTVAIALVWLAMCGCNPTGTVAPDDDAGGSGATDGGEGTADDAGRRGDAGERPPPSTEWFESPRAGASIFATGHSLIDRVFGLPLENGGPITAIARAAGKQHHSLLQDGAGSTARLRHQDISDGSYPEPQWASFDTVVVSERVDLSNTIRYEMTIQEVGWFVDQIRGAGDGQDEVFFYETWWAYDHEMEPRVRTWPAWAQYVRDELRLYECVAERVGGERGIRMPIVPGGIALADLMMAIEEGRAGGLRHGDIFEDYIHMTDLGDTFVAMVFFATIYRTPTTGMTIPGTTPEQAAIFSEIADRVVGDYFANFQAPTPSECRATLADFCRRYGDSCDEDLATQFPDGSF